MRCAGFKGFAGDRLSGLRGAFARNRRVPGSRPAGAADALKPLGFAEAVEQVPVNDHHGAQR